MKRYVKVAAAAVAASCLLFACTSAPRFSDVENKDWDLAEVRHLTDDIIFDRAELSADGFDEIFTLRFDSKDGRVNGVGAPNRFFAPYALPGKQEISIKTIATTLMAPIHEPEKLKEHDFFGYLQNATRWNMAKGILELYSQGEDGVQAVLTFIPPSKK